MWHLILQGLPVWPFSSRIAPTSLWHDRESRGCWHYTGLGSEVPECHFYHIVLVKENHLRFKRKRKRLHFSKEEWHAHMGRADLLVTNMKGPHHRDLPRTVSGKHTFWEAQIPRITQTRNYWGHLCCHVEKACLRTEAAQRKAGQEVEKKMVKLSFPLRWEREAIEQVVKSSRFGVIRPEFSSWLCHLLTMLLWES